MQSVTNLFFAVAIPYQLGFIYRRPTCPIIVMFCAVSEWLILIPERFRFLIQALSTLEVINHGRCVPELMQLVNKDFFRKVWVQFCFKDRTALIEKSTKLVSHESLRLCYLVITQPVQDMVVLNIKEN